MKKLVLVESHQSDIGIALTLENENEHIYLEFFNDCVHIAVSNLGEPKYEKVVRMNREAAELIQSFLEN